MRPHISKIQLCTLLESLPEAVFIVDRHGKLLDANTPALRFLADSQPPAEATRRQNVVSIRSAGSSTVPPMAASAVKRALQGEHIRNQRTALRVTGKDDDDEGRVEALISANPLVDPDHGVLGALLVIRDITETNELQRRLAASARDHAIGQMAAGLIHDFNNVLDTVDQAITVMEMREQTTREQQRSYLGMMHRAVRRGMEIVGRLRQYLRSGSGGTEPLDLRELLEDTVEMTRPMLQGAHQNVRLRSYIRPVGRVRGNAADLRRVFANLILNALQAMPEGGDLEVRCEPLVQPLSSDPQIAPEQGRARVSVCDTGSGIPADVQKKIFRAYFTTKAAGTGLGLSEAQRIVHSVGGRIHFHTEPGRGTRFMVDLPLIAESGSRGHQDEREKRKPRDNDYFHNRRAASAQTPAPHVA